MAKLSAPGVRPLWVPRGDAPPSTPGQSQGLCTVPRGPDRSSSDWRPRGSQGPRGPHPPSPPAARILQGEAATAPCTASGQASQARGCLFLGRGLPLPLPELRQPQVAKPLDGQPSSAPGAARALSAEGAAGRSRCPHLGRLFLRRPLGIQHSGHAGHLRGLSRPRCRPLCTCLSAPCGWGPFCPITCWPQAHPLP